MTVSTEVNQAAYTGNGVTTVFPYTFRILNASNLTVTRIDLQEVETALSLGTDYTVTGAGSYNGGAVTLPQPLPTGYSIVIERDLAIVQETDLRNQGTFFAEVHEDAFDYLTMIIQQVASWFGLALRRPTIKSKFYDAKQYRIANLADPANEQDAVNNRSMRSYVDQMIAGVVGGFGWFIQAGSGAVYRTFQNKMRDIYSVKDFGALGNGVNYETTAFSNTELAAGQNGNILVPAGNYRLPSPMLLSQVAKYFGDGVLIFDNAEWWRRGGSSGSPSVAERYTLFYDYVNQSDVTLTYDGVSVPFTWIDSRTIEAAGTAVTVSVKINIVNGFIKLGPVAEYIRSYNIFGNGGGGGKLNPQLPDPLTAPLGYDNTSFGPRALMDLKTGINNTAIGSKALMSNQSGVNNTAVGFLALYRSTGNGNTAVGSVSGEWVTTGSYNSFFGIGSGEKVMTGSYNTGIGFEALAEAPATTYTVAVGYRANGNPGNFSQSNSVYVGSFAGDFAVGSNNTMVGYRAGNCLNAGEGAGTAHDNVGIGMFAMRKNLTGNENVVIGVGAATESTVVSSSVVIGYGAAGTTTAIGPFTVAIGWNAMPAVSGSNNVAIGQQSANTTTTGAGNTAVGTSSLVTNVTGSNNTAIGNLSGRLTQAGVSTTSLSNTTTIGNDARVAASNEVQLGNSTTTTYVYGTVGNRSDARDKADVVETKLGIDFVLGLRPVSGKWNMREDYQETIDNGDGTFTTTFDQEGYEAETKKRVRNHQWFIAQDVEALCEKLGVDFGGLQHKAKCGGDDVYTLGYDEFIPPITKAVQECWSRLDGIESRVRALETPESNN